MPQSEQERKAVHAAANRRWQRNNPEKRKAIQQRYYQKNAERLRKARRERYLRQKLAKQAQSNL
jgi:hypothetical protein